MPIFTLGASRDILSVVVEAFAACFQTTRSRSDARRLVEGGSVQWNGTKFSDSKAQLPSEPGVLKLDKTRAVRVNA